MRARSGGLRFIAYSPTSARELPSEQRRPTGQTGKEAHEDTWSILRHVLNHEVRREDKNLTGVFGKVPVSFLPAAPHRLMFEDRQRRLRWQTLRHRTVTSAV